MNGPVDLRLVPAAIGAWLAAFVAVGAGPAGVLRVGAIGASMLAGWAVWWLVRRGPSRCGRPGGLRRGGRPGPAAHPWLVGLALPAACAMAVLLSTGVRLVDRATVANLAEQGAAVAAVGTVVGAPAPVRGPVGRDPQWRVPVRIGEIGGRGAVSAAAGTVTVIGGSGWADLAYGTAVVGRGRLSGTPTDLLLRASGPPTIHAPPQRGWRAVASIRRALLAVTDDLHGPARGLVPGIAIGDTTRLDAEVDDAMRTTGLTHLTAVSGGHFAIIIAVIAAVCGVVRLPRWGRAAVVAAASAGFVALVHPQPSVVRAAAMGAVGVVAVLFGRPSRAVAALAGSVIALLVVDPWLARSYGFALSVAATAGIALGTRPVARRLARWCGRAAAHAIAVPLCAQAACAPILVLLDPALAGYAVPANLLAAPAVGPATVLGVLAALVAPWSPELAALPARAAGACTWWIAEIARRLADLPGARWPWPADVGGAVLLGVVTGAGWVVLVRRRAWGKALGLRLGAGARAGRRARGGERRWFPAVVCLAAAALVVRVGIPTMSGLLHRTRGIPPDWVVAACDVGQGDALAIRTGAGRAIMIDVGPPGDAADRCLDQLGVRRLDLLVLTHFHADHVGGLAAVLDGRVVERALVPTAALRSAGAAVALRALSTAGIVAEPVGIPVVGDGPAAGVVWRVFPAAADLATFAAAGGRGAARLAGGGSPGERAGGGEAAVNDAGLIVEVEAGGLTVVALGDLESAGQERLIRSLRAAGRAGGVDVVKVAHHGSRAQSKELATHLRPRVAIVSVGANDYGHPTRAALALYEAVGAALVRTDQCGTFALVPRGAGIGLAGCRRPRRVRPCRTGPRSPPAAGPLMSPGRGTVDPCRRPPRDEAAPPPGKTLSRRPSCSSSVPRACWPSERPTSCSRGPPSAARSSARRSTARPRPAARSPWR